MFWYVVAGLLGLYVLRLLFKVLTRKSLAGEVAFVTGGGSGIGRTMCKMLAKRGCYVVIADINAAAAEAVAREINDEFEESEMRALDVQCDVTSPSSIQEAASRAQARYGAVTMLFNNAGIVSGKDIQNISHEEIERVIKVNTVAPIFCTKQFLPDMLARKKGHIVNIASSAGLVGVPKMTEYCASKAGCKLFNDALRLDLRRLGYTNIKTTVVCPFFINTGMFEGAATRFSWVLPILEEEYASAKIIQAVRENQTMLMMPRFLYLVPFIQAILPTWISDWLSDVLGATNCMDDFVGRRSHPHSD